MNFMKRKYLIFLIFQFILFAFSVYLFIQSPGIVSKRMILISCVVSLAFCMLTAWITHITKYQYYLALKKYPAQLVKCLLLIFIISLISFDLPPLYFLGPTVNLEISFFSNNADPGSTSMLSFKNGLVYVSKEEIELSGNSTRASEALIFNYSENHPAGFSWKGKAWDVLSMEFKETSTPTYLSISINNRTEVADIPISKNNQAEYIYIDVPNHSHYENISNVIAAAFLAFSSLFFLFLMFSILAALTKHPRTFSVKAAVKNNPKKTGKSLRLLQLLAKTKLGPVSLRDLAFIGLFLVCLGINFIPILHNKYPTGFAGLYTLMADLLSRNNFIPPVNVPFYGPGGIPYAYPFLGFYVSALITRLTGITLWQYVQIFPVVFYIFALIVLFLLAHELFKSRLLALGALIISASDPLLFYTNATSGGMVRGLALFLALSAMYLYLRSANNKNKNTLLFICCGILLGLTFMTHLVYGILAASFICIYILFNESSLVFKMKQIFLLTILAILVSAPWWLMIIQRYGFSPFFNSFGTHDYQGFFKTVPQGRFDLFFENLVNQLSIRTPLFSLLLIISIAYLFVFGWSPLVFSWLIIATLLGEVSWISGLLSGLILITFGISISTFIKNKKFLQVFYLVASILILIIFIQFGINIWGLDSEITPDYLLVAEYIASRPKNQSDIHPYLLVDKSHARGEWLPYLAQANPIFGPWGAEWTGNYLTENKTRQRLVNCLSSLTSLDCFELFDNEVCNSECDLYIIENQYPQVITYTKEQYGLRTLFTNNQYSILGQE